MQNKESSERNEREQRFVSAADNLLSNGMNLENQSDKSYLDDKVSLLKQFGYRNLYVKSEKNFLPGQLRKLMVEERSLEKNLSKSLAKLKAEEIYILSLELEEHVKEILYNYIGESKKCSVEAIGKQAEQDPLFSRQFDIPLNKRTSKRIREYISKIEEAGGRISIMLDSCTGTQLCGLAQEFGKERIGGYKDYIEWPANNDGKLPIEDCKTARINAAFKNIYISCKRKISR